MAAPLPSVHTIGLSTLPTAPPPQPLAAADLSNVYIVFILTFNLSFKNLLKSYF